MSQEARVLVRSAGHGDLKRVLEIAVKTLGSFHRHYVERTFWQAKTLVAESSGVIAGFAQFRRLKAGKSTIVAIVYIAVDPLQQRSGIGSTLLKAVEGEAVKRGASMVVATTTEANEVSKSFFSKHGYKLMKFSEVEKQFGHKALFELINLLQAYEDNLLMYKELSEDAATSFFNELKSLESF
ncbi:MAG: hypothetical protein DRJ31_01995 [Candidatus Methanomethylicota archaeon]|uniref:N-acetyltransferase domain-containing protein n=1 Tax=Thermoproteota archaeon TaxID=2056631 RepID=A0A497F0V9_9CREN|nr:MAG: hypothetical protein DRJ31_01995 [Candidatus Verstraetearchaeota archaeon]RLE53244.1 MAG: hypothetical protein DRJ33_01635 [Candidatus Verstraetearchaeota archaeon]